MHDLVPGARQVGAIDLDGKDIYAPGTDVVAAAPGQVIRIPAAALPAQPVTAAVTFIQGQVRQSGAPDASPSLSKGSTLTEGAQLQVAPDGFISIQLADGSVIKLQANTVLTLERMRRRPGNGATALDLQLHQYPLR